MPFASIRGETYAYWYLRRTATFVAEFTPVIKGEIDLVGYNGKSCFVEVRRAQSATNCPSCRHASKQHLARTAGVSARAPIVKVTRAVSTSWPSTNFPAKPPVVRSAKECVQPEM